MSAVGIRLGMGLYETLPSKWGRQARVELLVPQAGGDQKRVLTRQPV